jgi:3-oxoisoapionate kinase
MDEADLRAHLSRQTNARIALMSLPDLEGDEARIHARYAEYLRQGPDALLYDVLNDAHLRAAGRLIWREARLPQHFAAGSSGVEYALTAHWRASGVIAAQRATLAPVKPVQQLLVMSGSASPMTAQQIQWASRHGFDTLRAPSEELIRPDSAPRALRELRARALESLANGNSVVIYSAAGPDDPSIKVTRERLAAEPNANSAKLLGGALGRLAREVLLESGLRRVVIAGGDTSSYATRNWGCTHWKC